MVSQKPCIACKDVFPLSEFYKHPAMGDGHLNKCKACCRKHALENRANKLEEKRAYDIQRSKLPHRKEANKRQLQKTRSEHPERVRIYNAVRRALKANKLQKLDCERCGEKKSMAHHEDYSRPLEVVWLCMPCHAMRHKEIELEQQNKQSE